MSELPEIIDTLPYSVNVLNCNVCFDKGKRDRNTFKVYGDRKYRYRYYVCTRCRTIHKIKRIKK